MVLVFLCKWSARSFVLFPFFFVAGLAYPAFMNPRSRHYQEYSTGWEKKWRDTHCVFVSAQRSFFFLYSMKLVVIQSNPKYENFIIHSSSLPTQSICLNVSTAMNLKKKKSS